jgi:hypothetical protein
MTLDFIDECDVLTFTALVEAKREEIIRENEMVEHEKERIQKDMEEQMSSREPEFGDDEYYY